MGEAKAFTCRTSDGGLIPPGGSLAPVSVRVHIGPNLVEGKNVISNVSQVTCKNDVSNWIDYLTLNGVVPAIYQEGLWSGNFGVTVNGVDYDLNSPALNVKVLEITRLETVSVPMQFYIRLKKNPGRDIRVKKGDQVALFYFNQANNQSGCPSCGPYNWSLIADNDAYFTTTTCTINSAKQMNVEFGPISQDNFTQNVSNAIIKNDQNVNYHCEDTTATQDILVRLVGNASGFSSDAIKTTNANIGVAMMYQGKVIKPNETFKSRITNGIGSDTLTFVPIKNNVSSDKITTGPFSGSATLVFSAP
ncbi:fimbrial protein [Serratia marcescens]|nr:fimbrial protein [Serratia marcescens]